jgi:hypothetical protein
VTDREPLASGVLVTLRAEAPGVEVPRMLGRTAAERQVEFAAACGCAEVIAVGDTASPEAFALRHLSETLGLRYREVGGPHELGRAGLAGERLLVLQPDLLPDPAAFPRGEAAHDDAQRGMVLTLPAGPGLEAGFERIDLGRAWGGALVLPGALLPRLLDLPDDVEPASALLRIALQAGLPERSLDLAALADGSWSLPADPEQARLAEDRWLDRQLAPSPEAPLSRKLSALVLRRAGGRFLERRETRPVLLGVALALMPAAALLCREAWDATGFLLLALSVVLLELGLGLGRLQQARRGAFVTGGKLHRLRWLVDVALLASGVIAIEGDRLEQLFAPLVMLAAFHLKPAHPVARLLSLRDRGLIALVIAAGALLHSAQAGVMLAALLLMVLGILQSRPDWRITRA